MRGKETESIVRGVMFLVRDYLGMEGMASPAEAKLSEEGTPSKSLIGRRATEEKDTKIFLVLGVLGSGLTILCTLLSREGEMN